MNGQRDSLNRFLRDRGASIVGCPSGGLAARTHVIVGWTVLTVGFGLLASPVVGAPREAMFGSIGFLLAGFVNLQAGYSARLRFGAWQPAQIRYSVDALALLSQLCGKPTRKRPALEPTDEALDLLERATKAYQAIAAMPLANGDNITLSRLSPRVSLAAEEAMAEILDHVALLTRYPEGGGAVRGKIGTQIESLEEIALRLGELCSVSPVSGSAVRSRADDLLTDLRLEVLARSELASLERNDSESQHLN